MADFSKLFIAIACAIGLILVQVVLYQWICRGIGTTKQRRPQDDDSLPSVGGDTVKEDDDYKDFDIHELVFVDQEVATTTTTWTPETITTTTTTTTSR